ncbi:MAG: ribosome biogenesis GTPase Der [Oscillospiraceae bacterium]|nr:ribosome biogenesis GTPase Der [Oscillospiraceae bacterium]
MQKKIVAIVGRSNVGKSTLFNKLVGSRISIVKNMPHVTRDSIYADCFWRSSSFCLVDTSGLEKKERNDITIEALEQTNSAILSAKVVIFVVDLTVGITLKDEEIAKFLKKTKKPIILCVNKCDNTGLIPPEFYEFFSLGFDKVLPVSSVHGHGTGDLLDNILSFHNFSKNTITKSNLEKEKFIDVFEDKKNEIDFNKFNKDNRKFINIAIVGKPNAGKSSLINKIFGSKRCIVSKVSGTTRDYVDVEIINNYGNFCFVDTAGIRKKNKIFSDIDRLSVAHAKTAIKKSDICIIVIDITQGLTEQDLKIAGLVKDLGKALVIVANKCDIVNKNEQDESYIKRFESDFARKFSFLAWTFVIFVSAKTGKNLDKLFLAIKKSFGANSSRITTGKLNSFLLQSEMRVPPPSIKGKHLKIFYVTQSSTNPPTFIFFVNSKDLFHFSYQRYIENRIRENFDLTGTPIKFVIREKNKLSAKSISKTKAGFTNFVF